MSERAFLVVGASRHLVGIADGLARFGHASQARDLTEASARLFGDAAAAHRGLVVRAPSLVLDAALGWPGLTQFVDDARALDPRTPVLVVCDEPVVPMLNEAFVAGIALVRVPLGQPELVAFARRVALAPSDGSTLLATVVEACARRWRLSPRETELLARAVNGTARDALVSSMGVSENTLKTQIRTLLRKADSNHLDELVADVLREALHAPDARRRGSGMRPAVTLPAVTTRR